MKKLLMSALSIIIALTMVLSCLAEGEHTVAESDFFGTWKPDISTFDYDTNIDTANASSVGELLTSFSDMIVQIESGMFKLTSDSDSTVETYPTVFKDGTLKVNLFVDGYDMYLNFNDDGTLQFTWEIAEGDQYVILYFALRRDGEADAAVQEDDQEEAQEEEPQVEAQTEEQAEPQEEQQEETPQEDQEQLSDSEDVPADVVEGASLTYEEIKDIVFDTTIDGERVFKYPKDNEYFSVKNKQFPCKGAMLLTMAGVSDGKLEISSLLLVFDKDRDPDQHSGTTGVTFWEVEPAQQENVFDLVGESLNDYIDFANGGKLVFCMTQDMEKESQALYEYSPLIDQFSDKDLYKTQNYEEFDSFEAFKGKVYELVYTIYHGEEPGEKLGEESGEDQGTEDTDATVEILQKGSKGDEVVKLQNRLNELGYSVGTADGDFGNKTKTAVESFQKDHGLEVTGVVDEATYNAIFSAEVPAAEEAEESSGFSELTTFKGKMMDSVASQLTSATDLTTTSDNRAILAALLSLEFVTQQPDFTIDYTLPIYACKQGSIASVAVGGEKDYALIIFQMNPLSTSYGYLYGNDPATVRAALEATNESVWQVPLDAYNEKLAALVDQL